MKIGYKRLLIFTIILLVILLINAFFANFLLGYNRIILILFLLLFFKVYFITEKDRHRYIKDILFEVVIYSVTFFILYYTLGLVVGLARNQNYLTINGFINFIIPTVLYCVFREIFRYNMLCKADGNKLCTVLIVILFILFDITNDLFYLNTKLQTDIIKFIGLTFIPAISSNISYSYISKKMGYKPIILFDLIFRLFFYLIPIIPNPNEYIVSIIYLIYPVLFALRIMNFFNKKKDNLISRDYHKKKFKAALLPFVVIIVLVYFYSGYFKYYAIVIASGSMMPNINVGDVVIVDRKSNDFDVNDVIAYKKKNLIIVHRIVKKVKVGSSYYYYTKGDANSSMDDFAIDTSMIVGKVKLKLPYIGYPTVWFSKD